MPIDPITSGLAGLVSRLRSLGRGVLRRQEVESEMAEEFRHHLELRTEHLIRQGLSREEAHRRARIEFGPIEAHRESARASRGLGPFDELRFSWLDVKLGLRMMAKYPGLSLVAVLGMAVAIAIGAGAFGSIYGWMHSDLPLPEGDRVVFLRNHDTRDYGRPHQRNLHDYLLWSDELSTVPELAAYRDEPRNLILPDGGAELVRVAEMTASGFVVARVPPLLGRPLLEQDQRTGAQPVAVIGYDEWQRRFDGDAGVLGRPLRLGSEVHTIVGVMPEGYRFPVNHQFWTPLRLNAADWEWGGGPGVSVFGRLADGITLEQAQAELTPIGLATAAAHPATHEHLRPRVMPYPMAFVDVDDPTQAWVFRAIPLTLGLLLLVVAVNVGILVYARTTTRLGEIAVRSALGASRRRVVMQLFAEALVLALLAAGAGLMTAAVGLSAVGEWMKRIAGDRIPYWWEFGLSPELTAYVAGLAVVAAVVIGVVPALKATGRRLHAGLQQLSTRGSSMQLGRLWTALIVAQVALAVAVLPFAVYVAGTSIERASAEPGYPADAFLRARVVLEPHAPPSGDSAAYAAEARARFEAGVAELVRRLDAEPAVAGVSWATHFPGGGLPSWIEVEGGGSHVVQIAGVDPEFFDVADIPVLAGRGFTAADLGEAAGTAIVDEIFVAEVLGGRDALGRRVRQVTRRPGGGPDDLEEGPWREIVGIVPDYAGPQAFDATRPKLYQPQPLAELARPTLAVRVGSGPADLFAGRVRDLAAAVDPALQLEQLHSAAEYQGFGEQAQRFVALAMIAMTLSVLLLSAAGIYAMLSFTVARRRREIGIRSALGADPRRLLGSIFARAGWQIGAGVMAGLLLAVGLDRLAGGGPLGGSGMVLLPAVAALMTAVGLAAALGPARRGLAVPPTEALREE